MSQQAKRQDMEAQRHEPTADAVAMPGERVETGRVRIIAGADVQDLDLVGRTVAEARGVAQLVFGINPAARAFLDGRAVGEDHVLGASESLEFTKPAGRKGGLLPNPFRHETPPTAATIELDGDRAEYRRGGDQLARTTVRDLFTRAAGIGEAPARWRLTPQRVRLMTDRANGRTTAVVIEMPPGPRQVRWISERAHDPVDGKLDKRRLSFPWVVLVVVFSEGELTNVQQAFFRTAPLATVDDRLCYTNLLNVARGYNQESWFCLFNLPRSLARLGWDERVRAVTDHFWQAAYTKSADEAEGNSFWSTTLGLDPRLESPVTWERATEENPYFALEVAWRPAPHTLRETLGHMLDLVAPWQPIERTEQLATLMQQSS